MNKTTESFLKRVELLESSKDDEFCDETNCNPEVVNYLFMAKKILENYYLEKLKKQ